MGPEEKRVMENELETVVLQRRAIRTARAVPRGHALSEKDMTVLRPCPPDALPPYRLGELLGRKVARDMEAGDVIRLSDVE